ncbi:hypothetical protein A2973_03475 [Candidatus Gottesmanbacteria bacterium RIFCSPLOWO2_01_FULL_49_10]|uniref:UmuC domain-containing protein n=1 Tax=Candidatus Gottesmanbacteria bacterium RIFCSPLOWO2_01_FULL_49_10 TaxID=1798396 RepID=A0A1F6AVS2_9BACT|nr:MAG: hypothetical protein A2973_03475 [Candidatus Gottesmanbacteria bacterium RIFCSPLOWO2_01_FULL_49_10]
MAFNPKPPTVMHIDLNSCFATVEQQANPLLRGKPLVVAAYTTGNGCILASSVEAKRLGVKTGMRVWEGKNLYPRLVVLPPDPEKYRWVNRKLRVLLSSYTPYLSVESIDEMVMDLAGTPMFRQAKRFPESGSFDSGNRVDVMLIIAKEIKQRIKSEIGEWLTVSVGIAPNRYLAKVASGLHKPDGLDVITEENIESVFQTLRLEDLCGIKEGNAGRLRYAAIRTPVELCRASPIALVNALRSKTGWDWWQRLHGWEDGVMYKHFNQPEETQKTYGQSFALGLARIPSDPEIAKIMAQLIVKMGRRLRTAGFVAYGMSVSLLFTDYSHWVKNVRTQGSLFADSDFLTHARALLAVAPGKPIRIMAVTSFNLTPRGTGQIPLWNTDERKWRVTDAIDAIANRWGEFTVTPGRMLAIEQKVLDRIAFGRVRS